MSGLRHDIKPDEKTLAKMREIFLPKNDESPKALQDKIRRLSLENEQMKRKMRDGTYFTDAELKAHDALVAKQAIASAEALILKNMHEEMDKEYKRQVKEFEKETTAFWDKAKEEFKSGDEEENYFAWCRCMWAIPIAVLVEKFHWAPITEESCGDNRQALVRFCNACIQKAEDLRTSQTKDIRTLCREIGEAYGASFVINEEAVQ